MLLMMGLRKGELASARFRDFDLGRRRLRVHGKGGKIRQTPIPTEELRQEIATLSLRRDPMEHLLYPEKRGPGERLLWEDRRKPLSGPAMHRWWYRCLTRAGVVAEGTTSGKKMHGARYTAGTEFYLATGDIYATQQLLGHADVSTTANIYVQGSPADLEQKLDKVWGE
jgi:integrase